MSAALNETRPAVIAGAVAAGLEALPERPAATPTQRLPLSERADLIYEHLLQGMTLRAACFAVGLSSPSNGNKYVQDLRARGFDVDSVKTARRATARRVETARIERAAMVPALRAHVEAGGTLHGFAKAKRFPIKKVQRAAEEAGIRSHRCLTYTDRRDYEPPKVEVEKVIVRVMRVPDTFRSAAARSGHLNRAAVSKAKDRTCMCCQRVFRSEGPGNRLCDPCRRGA